MIWEGGNRLLARPWLMLESFAVCGGWINGSICEATIVVVLVKIDNAFHNSSCRIQCRAMAYTYNQQWHSYIQSLGASCIRTY